MEKLFIVVFTRGLHLASRIALRLFEGLDISLGAMRARLHALDTLRTYPLLRTLPHHVPNGLGKAT